LNTILKRNAYHITQVYLDNDIAIGM